MPFREIQPNRFYDLASIETEILGGQMRGRQFLALFRPRKVSKSLWWGRHLIEAIEGAPAVGERDRAEPETRGRRKAAGVREADLVAIPRR